MAEAVDLPAGFELDAPDAGLPEGFTLDEPAQREGMLAGLWREIKNPRESLSPENLRSAALRAPVKAITAIPGMFADATAAAYNLVRPQTTSDLISPGSGDMRMPSQVFEEQVLNRFTRPPEGLGKAAEAVSSAMLGARLPMPQVAQAPKGFAPPGQLLRNQTLAQAQKEGYVVPPGSSNPTIANRMLEGISGKLKLQQEAAIRNQPVSNRVMAESIGQSADAPLTQGALNVVRSQAVQAGYAPLRNLGTIRADKKYLDALDEITAAAKGASRSFPGMRPSQQVDDVVGALKQKQFDSGDAVDAISHLRSLSDDAYGSGEKTLGKAYKSASKALEEMIERDLEKLARQVDNPDGKTAAELLKNFRSARTQIAKTYTAGKSLVEETGNFDPRKVAAELAKGKPLTGGQRTVGAFTRAFPKASRLMDESYPAISPLDAYGSVIAAGATDSLAPLGLPLTRVGIREYLLSQAGQARAIPQAFTPRETLGAYGAYPSLYNAMQGLFSE